MDSENQVQLEKEKGFKSGNEQKLEKRIEELSK